MRFSEKTGVVHQNYICLGRIKSRRHNFGKVNILKNPRSCFLGLATWMLIGCGGGGASSSPTGTVTTPPNPPVNRAPIFSGMTNFEFDEGADVIFSVEATDPEGRAVTFSIDRSEDFGSFSIDASTGEITGVPRGNSFDFENPSDGNSDNTYNLTIIASDGTNTTEQAVTVIILDIEEPLTCSSGERIEVLENTEGFIYTFVAEKEDSIPQGISFGPERTVTRSGGESVSEQVGFSITLSRNTNDFSVAEYNLSLFHYLNAETLESQDRVFTVTTQAEYEGEVTGCSVEVEVLDVTDEVTSGVKLTGSYPNNYSFEHEEIGDIDGDGLTDFWISSIRNRDNLPPDHEGHVIFGKKIEAELREAGPEEIILNDLTPTEAVKIRGSFPSVFPGRRFIGNTLNPHPIGDVDGDGRPELLLALSTPQGALESAFADRPLAYLIWGDALLAQTDGQIDLNNLLPSEGIALEGLGGINRRRNTAISGDFDGDGIDDIVVRVPENEIRAEDSSSIFAPTFFVFGDFLRASKGVASIDLLDSLDNINPDNIVVLAQEGKTFNTDVPREISGFPFDGSIIEVLSDIDGDGSDEIVGTGHISQFERSVGTISGDIIKNAKGKKGVVLFRDVPDEDINLIRTTENIVLSDRDGDFDGDNVPDMIFMSRESFDAQSSFTLLRGRALRNNTSPELIQSTPSENVISFVSSGEIERIFDVSFIPDIDGDGRDEILFSYTNIVTIDDDFESRDVVALVLARAINDHPTGEPFILDDIKPGDGLRFTNSSIRKLGSVFSALSDVDGDGVADLLISPSENGPVLRREAFLIPGSDMRVALNSGSVVFDLEERFRASPEKN